MLRKYRIEAVESRVPVSHADFFRPRNLVTLVCLEDGKVLKVLLPSRRSWKRGDEIELNEFELAAALESEPGPSEPEAAGNSEVA